MHETAKHTLSDNDIKEHFLKNGHIISTYASKQHCKQYSYYDYLYSRFYDISETDTIQEILYRIVNNVETKPVCKICGKPVKFMRFSTGYRQYCSMECSRKSDEYYQHKRETRSKTYENIWQNKGYDLKIDPNDQETFTIFNACSIHNPFKIRRGTFYNRYDGDIVLCPLCNPERNPETSIEQIIKNILDNHNINYVQHDRTIIKPRELDFYLPDYKIAIECNGIYWHSGKDGLERTNDKYSLASKANIQLLTFWEDDIHSKKNIIESIIKTHCNLNKRIFARNCQVKEISSDESRKFINENHLQGNINASIKLGLFYNNELVEVMTFGKLRKITNQKHIDGSYELYRLCSKSGYSIIGGASKLLKYFETHYEWKEIISYCHSEISNGNVYEKLGFKFDKDCGNGYTYYNYKISKNRISRFNLRKSIIAKDSNESGDEILAKLGYLKCYDAGVKKYRKLLNSQNL